MITHTKYNLWKLTSKVLYVMASNYFTNTAILLERIVFYTLILHITASLCSSVLYEEIACVIIQSMYPDHICFSMCLQGFLVPGPRDRTDLCFNAYIPMHFTHVSVWSLQFYVVLFQTQLISLMCLFLFCLCFQYLLI